MWFACTMDDGIIASGETKSEVLRKIGKNSAQYKYPGFYEARFRNSERIWSVWICNGEETLNRNGWNVNDEHNTWEYNN